MSNVATVRHAALNKQALDATPEVLFIGSSQVGRGFDMNVFTAALPEQPCREISIGDMDCIRLLFAHPYFCVGPNDRVILYLSNRDIMDPRAIQSNWMRPFASFKGLHSIIRTEPAAMIPAFREVCDLALAASFELWRSRDAMRHVLTHLKADEYTDRRADAQRGLQAQMDMGLAIRQDISIHTLLSQADKQLAALEHAIRQLQIQGAHITILEGQINPLHETEESQALQNKLNQFLQTNAVRLGIDYIPQTTHQLHHPPEEWRDATHLNETGARKLTEFVASHISP